MEKDFKVDLSKYEENFYQVIDSLILLAFGKQIYEILLEVGLIKQDIVYDDPTFKCLSDIDVRKIEIGAWKPEAGAWRLRKWMLESGNWRSDAKKWRLEIRKMRPEAGKWYAGASIRSPAG